MIAALHPTTRTRLLTAADLPAAARLQQQVGSDLPTGFLRGKTESELATYLSGRAGVAYGVSSGDMLLSMALLRLPGPQHPLTGERFPLVPEADWPLRAAILEHAMVAPAARRSGHQQALICARIAHARQCAGVRWICAGVQLTNAASWRNLMRSGLMVVKAGPQAGRTLPTLSMNLDNAVQHIRRPDQRWVIEQDAGGTPLRCAPATSACGPAWAARWSTSGSPNSCARVTTVHRGARHGRLAGKASPERNRRAAVPDPAGPRFTSPGYPVHP